MAKRFGETAVRFRLKTLHHLIHLAPSQHLCLWFTGLGRHPNGHAIGSIGTGVRIDAAPRSSFLCKLSKKPGKLVYSRFSIRLCIHAEWIIEESPRQHLSRCQDLVPSNGNALRSSVHEFLFLFSVTCKIPILHRPLSIVFLDPFRFGGLRVVSLSATIVIATISVCISTTLGKRSASARAMHVCSCCHYS